MTETYIHCVFEPVDIDEPTDPRAWYITHGLGTPAAGMFTEVIVPEELGVPEWDVETVVRLAAFEAYDNRWAFVYPPDRGPGETTRRERIVVTGYQRY